MDIVTELARLLEHHDPTAEEITIELVGRELAEFQRLATPPGNLERIVEFGRSMQELVNETGSRRPALRGVLVKAGRGTFPFPVRRFD